MAMEYFKVFNSYLRSLELLSNAERGRLFTALIEYNMTGEVPELQGNEKFVFPMMKYNIDSDTEAYAKKVKANSINGAKGGRPRKTEQTEENRTDF